MRLFIQDGDADAIARRYIPRSSGTFFPHLGASSSVGYSGSDVGGAAATITWATAPAHFAHHGPGCPIPRLRSNGLVDRRVKRVPDTLDGDGARSFQGGVEQRAGFGMRASSPGAHPGATLRPAVNATETADWGFCFNRNLATSRENSRVAGSLTHIVGAAVATICCWSFSVYSPVFLLVVSCRAARSWPCAGGTSPTTSASRPPSRLI